MLQNIKAISSLRSPHTILIEWNIGKLCNYNCAYCNPALHDSTSTHLSYSVMTDTIDFLLTQFDNDKILLTITGGEPTLNPMLFTFCKHLYKLGITNIVLTTNGSQSLSYYVKISKYVDSITFSQHFNEVRQLTPFLTKMKEFNKSRNSFMMIQVMGLKLDC